MKFMKMSYLVMINHAINGNQPTSITKKVLRIIKVVNLLHCCKCWDIWFLHNCDKISRQRMVIKQSPYCVVVDNNNTYLLFTDIDRAFKRIFELK